MDKKEIEAEIVIQLARFGAARLSLIDICVDIDRDDVLIYKTMYIVRDASKGCILFKDSTIEGIVNFLYHYTHQ